MAGHKTITKIGHVVRLNDVPRRCDTDGANDALVAVSLRGLGEADSLVKSHDQSNASGSDRPGAGRPGRRRRRASKRVDVAGGPVSFPDRARRRRYSGC
jgi:hypothetical protein